MNILRPSTESASGPYVAFMWLFGLSSPFVGISIPFVLVLLGVGLNPKAPQNAAGHLILPPISDPIANGTHLDPTNPPSPPELPAHVLV